jgi:hypothetical protein
VTRPLLVCVVIAVALRLPFVDDPLGSDEAGLLLVVRHWDPGSAELYGEYWVDRPPLLLAYFWLADLLPGEVGVRLLGCLFAAALVGGAVVSGHLLGGLRAAWGTGLVAAFLGSSYVVAGHLVNGMVQAASLTMSSCALTIAATRGSPSGPRLLGSCLAAGAAGMAAVMVKQNFVEGLVFGCVVLVASWVTGELRGPQVAAALACGAAGAGVVGAAAFGWAVAAGVDPHDLWFAVYEFRTLATEVLTATDPGTLRRLASLTAAFLLSGLGLVLVLLVAGARDVVRERSARRYLAGAFALAAVAVVGVLVGGSWWRHYLVQLVPTAVLVTALLARRPGWWSRAMRSVVAVIAASTVVGMASGAVVEADPPEQVRVGRYLAQAVEPGDTGLVTWGHAETLLYAGLPSPYRHLWSLPTRTLDPRLTELMRVMEGPSPPTWVVRWNAFDSWRLDEQGRLVDAIEERYRLVAEPCGRWVFLLDEVDRDLPDADPCA